jgi:hypothetical protein
MRVPRKLIRRGDPLSCLKCGGPIDVLALAAEVAAGRSGDRHKAAQAQPGEPQEQPSADEPAAPAPAPRDLAPGECEFCDVRLRQFQFLQQAVKVCPRCGKQLTLEEPAPMPDLEPPRRPRPQAAPTPVYRRPEQSSQELVELPAAVFSDDNVDAGETSPLQGPTVAAFLFGSFALLFLSLPSLSMLCRPLAAIGLVVAVVAAVLTWRRQASIHMQVVVALLCALGVYFGDSSGAGLGRPLPPERTQVVAPPEAEWKVEASRDRAKKGRGR